MDTLPLPSPGNIDHRSPIPLYFQLKGVLEREIVATRWQTGGRLPSEGEICDHFKISRATVRQALGLLENEGMITRHKGRGTFVSESKTRSWLLQSPGGFFSDEVDRLGRAVTSRLLRVEVETLPAWACEALDIAEGSDGVRLERLRSVQGKLALYETSFLGADLAPTILGGDVEHGSLYELLARERGLEPVGGRRVLEALGAPDAVAELLEVKKRSPLVYIESVAWDSSLRPFHCYQAWVRTDRMRIEIQVVSAPGRPNEAPPLALSADG
jgi:GntR family transcriptional regulator